MSFASQGAPRWRALLPLLAGIGLLTAVSVAACRSEPAEPFGTPAVTAPASSEPPAATASVPVRKGAVPTGAAEVAPARLRIGALDLDAAVAPVGIDPETGDFAVPPSVDRVGWYRFGPAPGGPGSAVLAAHVDMAIAAHHCHAGYLEAHAVLLPSVPGIGVDIDPGTLATIAV